MDLEKLTDRLMDLLMDRLIDHLTDHLTDRLTDCLWNIASDRNPNLTQHNVIAKRETKQALINGKVKWNWKN